MLGKTRGIVLHTIIHNDKYSIIHIYTEVFGRMSYLVSRNRSKKSNTPKTIFMPLHVLNLEVDHQPKRDLQRIRETKLCFPQNEISSHPVKNALALFISEVLYRVLRVTEPDRRMFDFLHTSIRLLEATGEGLANYHIVFLLQLLRYLGIFPQVEDYREGFCFDMSKGTFASHPPLHKYHLNPEESSVFVSLLRISFENMSLYSFSRQNRASIINHIIMYYRLHLPEFSDVKSLAVLQALFD